MNNKFQARMRRARRARMKIRELGRHRLTVRRSARHMYAQVIEPSGSRVLAQASTLDKSLRGDLTKSGAGNAEAAAAVGALVAQRAVDAGIRQVAFDRSGYKYHGRVKALAEAARNGGLEF